MDIFHLKIILHYDLWRHGTSLVMRFTGMKMNVDVDGAVKKLEQITFKKDEINNAIYILIDWLIDWSNEWQSFPCHIIKVRYE